MLQHLSKKMLVEGLNKYQLTQGINNLVNFRSDKVNMMSIHQKLKTMLKKLEGSEYKVQNT